MTDNVRYIVKLKKSKKAPKHKMLNQVILFLLLTLVVFILLQLWPVLMKMMPL